jgi:hypothetical protein
MNESYEQKMTSIFLYCMNSLDIVLRDTKEGCVVVDAPHFKAVVHMENTITFPVHWTGTSIIACGSEPPYQVGCLRMLLILDMEDNTVPLMYQVRKLIKLYTLQGAPRRSARLREGPLEKFFESRNAPSGGDMCTICQDTSPDLRRLRTLRCCGHVFHDICLEDWEKSSCPVCRQDVRSITT